MRTTLTIDQIIAEFLSEQSVNKMSAKTYMSYIRNFYNWCSINSKDKREPKTSDISEYRQHLLSEYSTKYTIAILTILKYYFTWLETKGYYDNISKAIKLPRQPREFLKEPLSDHQVSKLLATVDQTTVKGRRDYLMIILMLIRGLRCVEISRMNLSDIVTNNNQSCIIIQRKAHYEKDDFINVDDLMNEINRYLDDIDNKDEDGPIFRNLSRNQNGKRLSPMSIGKIITDYFEQAGIKNKWLTPHSLRHTAAVTLLRSGESIDNIQIFLGHSNSEITKIYTKYANNEIKIAGKQGRMLKNHFLTCIMK